MKTVKKTFAPIQNLENFMQNLINFMKQKGIQEIGGYTIVALEDAIVKERDDKERVNKLYQEYLEQDNLYRERRTKRYKDFSNVKQFLEVMYTLDPEYKTLFSIRKKRNSRAKESLTANQ